MLEVMYSSGLRVSELVGLDTGHLRLDLGLAMGGGGQGRPGALGWPVGSRAMEALKGYLTARAELLPQGMEQEALFLNQKGGRITQRSVQRLVARFAGELSAGRKLSPHALRHAMATHPVGGRGGPEVGAGDAGPQEPEHDPKNTPTLRWTTCCASTTRPIPGPTRRAAREDK